MAEWTEFSWWLADPDRIGNLGVALFCGTLGGTILWGITMCCRPVDDPPSTEDHCVAEWLIYPGLVLGFALGMLGFVILGGD